MPAVVLLRADPEIDAPLGRLAALLASAIDTLFGDPTLVLHLVSPGGARAEQRIGGARHVWLAAPPKLRDVRDVRGARAEPIVRATLERYRKEARYVFLDASLQGEPDPPRWLERLATQIVYLTRDPETPLAPPSQGCTILRTVVLADTASEDRLSAKRHWLETLAHGVAGDLARRRAAPKIRSAPYPQSRIDPAWCRVRLDLATLAHVAPLAYRELPEAARRTFGRWARALTRRRVGLALGGAGAWGYASAALILELESAGVPIDLIAGSSSGALVGGYYCRAGVAGIERLIARGPEIARSMPLMLLSSAVAEYMVEADLGDARLEQLEIPLLPVATNLSRLRPEVIVEGSIGFGVRASVSAPGIFARTIAGGSIYVDGAVSDNMPVALVESMGADLVIATNPLPAAPPRSTGGVLARLRDFTAAFELLLHVAGEREPSRRRIIYSAGPAAAPLRTTFDYGSAARLVARVTHDDPRFRAAVDASVAAWRGLSRSTLAPGRPRAAGSS
ncbi:MAG TPA: patatin-like phospholipase family protein [Kofleriaceae bacterium]